MGVEFRRRTIILDEEHSMSRTPIIVDSVGG
jgi:hypothetical protein